MFFDYKDFEKKPLQEKLFWFDNNQQSINYGEKNFHEFLQNLITNPSENTYVRKKALELYVNLAELLIIKKRYVLNLLIDNWIDNDDLFLDICRLQKLFVFYTEESEEIENIYIKSVSHNENEVISEANYQLGLINLFKANSINDKKDYIQQLRMSLNYFIESTSTIENRVDAAFMQNVVSILIEIANGNNSVDIYLKKIAEYLWIQRVFSLDNSVSNLHVGLYRTLYAFKQINAVQPSGWLDYKKEFNDLCYYFYSIKNHEITTELTQNAILKSLSDNLIHKSIEPLFALNFSAEICKIDKMIHEVEITSVENEFLVYLRELATSKDQIIKSKKDVIFNKLSSSYPHINKERILNELALINEPIKNEDILRLVELISEYSYENLLDYVISSAINMQGNLIYRKATENERNTFLASCLEMAGFNNKDQTLWGRSNGGKTSGEIDIFVKKPDGKPFSIIEALNLSSVDKNYLNMHLEKVFKYDTTGLKYNFILVYSSAKNFSDFWKRYTDHISTFCYPYLLVNFKELEGYDFANIRVGQTSHNRNDKKVYLYHIVIDMN